MLERRARTHIKDRDIVQSQGHSFVFWFSPIKNSLFYWQIRPHVMFSIVNLRLLQERIRSRVASLDIGLNIMTITHVGPWEQSAQSGLIYNLSICIYFWYQQTYKLLEFFSAEDNAGLFSFLVENAITKVVQSERKKQSRKQARNVTANTIREWGQASRDHIRLQIST
jgi:hypothetical protein